MKKNKRIPSAFMSITNTEVNYVSDAIKMVGIKIGKNI